MVKKSKNQPEEYTIFHIEICKYINNETYSSTEPRQRFLWIEFDKPLANPNDTYFIRSLAYSPDPLLAKWEPAMLKAPEEASLAINPEPIRIISPGHTDDKSGLNAMQEMTASIDISPVHYIAPLPPGLHSASPEQRSQYEIGAGGRSLHWPEIDEDLSVNGLLRDHE